MERTLSSRWWRLRNSAWVLVPILSLGLLTWAAFLFVGSRARKKSWLLFAAIWGVVLVAYFVGQSLNDVGENAPATAWSSFLAWVLILNWVGGMVHVAVTNRSWLRWKAQSVNNVPWHAQANGAGPSALPPAAVASEAEVNAALRGHVVLASPPSTQAPPAVQLDLNLATAEQFKAALGLDQAWGEWLVATRARLGQFSTVDQLLTEGQVPPHLYLPAKDKFMVSKPAVQPVARVRRRLDL